MGGTFNKFGEDGQWQLQTRHSHTPTDASTWTQMQTASFVIVCKVANVRSRELSTVDFVAANADADSMGGSRGCRGG